MPIELIGAFESTYLSQHDVDVLELTDHVNRRRSDLELLRNCGIRRLRYPIRWHRLHRSDGTFDWSETDTVLGHLQDQGFRPIVDLVHHCSFPRLLDGGFVDPRFPHAYLSYCEAFAKRYPWIAEYTLLNEPFSTLFLSGQEAVWPPYGSGMESFVLFLTNALPALSGAMHMFRDLLPKARHIYNDACEGHSAAAPTGEAMAAFANDRRFFILDVLTGFDVDPRRPFFSEVERAGGGSLFELSPASIDVLGLDYYAHMEWSFIDETKGMTPSPKPRGLTSLILEYWDRYRLPVMLTETNIRGYPSDRASWLKYTLEQCELAQEAGAELTGYCWFPTIDSCDWDSLLANADGHVDPVGVFWLDENLDRRHSVMSDCFTLAAAGAAAAELPAYRFRPPVDSWLAALLPQMEHWDWQPPPEHDLTTHLDAEAELGGLH